MRTDGYLSAGAGPSTRKDPAMTRRTTAQHVLPISSPRLRRLAQLLAVALVGGGIVVSAAPAASAAACPAGSSPVVCENLQPGDTDWEVSGAGSTAIEGFATSMSVNAGESISFKVRTMSVTNDTQQVLKPYTIDIYRMGWYGGAGARKWGSVTPTLRTQPDCADFTDTGLVDCGNWGVSGTWAVPSNAVSGVYIAHLTRTDDPSKDNHIIFVVRNDGSHSALVAQTSDTTWQAYNDWGGNSLYGGQPAGRAYKVSYNRPFATRMTTPDSRDFFFGSEYAMVRFMERNGYDVSYLSGIDTDRSATLIKNHTTFISMGHDEYWSKNQRANVTAARDAGVNLAFFSGNEVFWKTRWEASQDGTNTAYRTLVTYKETKANDKIDPSPEWTGTWRDPRFSPPSDGGRPENSLTGQFWTVNTGTYAIQVPAADGKMRLWRNTSVANLAAGATATLAEDSLGYEWDEDPDNGYRPAGLIRMSTTTQNVPAKIIDYGSNVAPGPATHHLTMYRAASGALVFGAGTVQWSWGLDDYHDGNQTAVDVRMQQATVNILADMGAQPATRMAGLVAATASTDTTAPSTIITSPAAGATARSGSTLTVSGTASDAGGGRIGGVEVSLDGGGSWHPATGRETWSYAGTVSGTGPITVLARAVDDSVNIDATPASVTVNGACPCTLLADLDTPKTPAENDARAINVGTRFTADRAGYVTGVRFYKGTGNTGTHVGALWSATGQKLAQATFANESATGWQTATFTPAPAVTAGTQYVVSYNAPNGHYSVDAEYFLYNGVDRSPLHAPQTTGGAPNGVYGYGTLAFPADSYRGGNYWVDPVFDTVAPPDTIPPNATAGAPLAGSSSVSRTAPVTVTFDEPVQAATIAITVTAQGGGAAAGTVTYDAPTRVATFTPSTALAAGTLHTVSVSGAKDVSNNTMTAPVTWSFTTQKAPAQAGVCPCGIWDDTAVPATVTVIDAAAVELGAKFKADADGKITGVRFYKGPQNTGTHVGSLWNETGTTRLAQVTFTGESTAGWQTATFSTPVTVTAGTTYVVSYNTSSGYYSATSNGLAAAVDSPPLHTLPGGALYRYGASAFPTNGSNANYWVDVVYVPLPDTTPPTVTATSPAAGATNVSVAAGARATFSEAMTAGSIAMTLQAGGTSVAGTVSYNATTKTATFQPAASLTASTVYTATVTAASDAAGNALATPKTWSFTTAGVAACPCTLFADDATPTTAAASDGNGVEVGVKFTSDTAGWISGVRFYKGAGNGGSHTGTLWSATGTKLATGTFTAETATGWQQLTFGNPVAVTAGTTYVASYYAPQGRYAVDSQFFASAVANPPLTALANSSGGNGVYRYGASSGFPVNSYGASNYWVDVVFVTAQPSDTTPPQVVDRTPLNGATSVPVTAAVKAVFDEDLIASTVQMTVAPTAGGAAAAGTVAYDANERTASFTPTAALESATSYRATVTAAKDLAGNSLAAPVTWTFTTAAAATSGCPCTLFADSATPQIASAADAGPLELGVRFSSDTDGFVKGVRFYKGAGNTGTHIGSLWSSTGTRLATATFTNESATGWQTVTFATPVAVTAGTTYTASYFAPQGGYALTRYQFEFAGVDRAPLHAPRAVAGAPNGVYVYGGTSAFPTSGTDSNYWVDVVFAPTAG